MAPKTTQPMTLTANVPSGKSVPLTRSTIEDKTCRATAPIAPPTATARRFNVRCIMPAFEVLTGSALGSLLGMRHALEPDHLTAVSTLMTSVPGERSSVRAAMLGATWGLGHTLSLVIVGAVLVVLRAEMPARVADLFELVVAIMLVGLGIRAIVVAVRQGPIGPVHTHHHGPLVHNHAGPRPHVHVGRWTLARRPLL